MVTISRCSPHRLTSVVASARTWSGLRIRQSVSQGDGEMPVDALYVLKNFNTRFLFFSWFVYHCLLLISYVLLFPLLFIFLNAFRPHNSVRRPSILLVSASTLPTSLLGVFLGDRLTSRGKISTMCTPPTRHTLPALICTSANHGVQIFLHAADEECCLPVMSAVRVFASLFCLAEEPLGTELKVGSWKLVVLIVSQDAVTSLD